MYILFPSQSLRLVLVENRQLVPKRRGGMGSVETVMLCRQNRLVKHKHLDLPTELIEGKLTTL